MKQKKIKVDGQWFILKADDEETINQQITSFLQFLEKTVEDIEEETNIEEITPQEG